MLKTEMPQEDIEQLGIWQAATADGYWEEASHKRHTACLFTGST
jgi:hypothetical protein